MKNPIIRHQEQGLALVVTLIILTVLTLLGLVALRASVAERVAVQNTIDVNQAFSVAEIGLREAEEWLRAKDEPPAPGDGGFQIVFIGDEPAYDDANDFLTLEKENWANQGTVVLPNQSGDGVIGPAYFFIRETDVEGGAGGETAGVEAGLDTYTYEITAVGYGAKLGTKMILQSTFVRYYEDEPHGERRTWRYIRE